MLNLARGPERTGGTRCQPGEYLPYGRRPGAYEPESVLAPTALISPCERLRPRSTSDERARDGTPPPRFAANSVEEDSVALSTDLSKIGLRAVGMEAVT